MFTREEKEAARALLDNTSAMNLLCKVFFPPQDSWISKMPLAASDAEVGQYAKACLLAEEKVRERFDQLKQIAYVAPERAREPAPRR